MGGIHHASRGSLGVDRYGAREVGHWFFEVWNEPNLEAFWTGSREDYFKLYRTTVGAIKWVDPSLRVGGPATARDGWIDEFIDFCETADVAVDFVRTITIRRMPCGATLPTRKRNLPAAAAASRASGLKIRDAAPADARSTIRSGIPHQTLAIRSMTNRTPRRSW